MNTHTNTNNPYARLLSNRLLAGGLVALLMAFAGFGDTAYASGSAYFILSPSSGTYIVGNTINLSVSVYASSGDDVHAAQANLSYSTSTLQYLSYSAGGSFDVGCPGHSGGGGSVSIACGASGAVSGSALLATVSFKVLASGSTTVSMTGGSDIDNGGGSSVWDGSLKSASFTLKTASTSTSSKPKSSTTTSSKTTTPTTTTPTTKPTTTTTTPTTTQPTRTQSASGSITVTVTDSSGQPIGGARVALDGQNVEYSTVKGIAGFTGVSAGSHTVTITAPGKKPFTTKLTVGSNENRQLNLKLANSNMPYIIIGSAIGALVLIGAGAFGYFRFFRHRGLRISGGNVVPNQAAVVSTPAAPAEVNADTVAAPGGVTSTALPRPSIVAPNPSPAPQANPAPFAGPSPAEQTPAPAAGSPVASPEPPAAPPKHHPTLNFPMNTNTPPKIGST